MVIRKGFFKSMCLHDEMNTFRVDLGKVLCLFLLDFFLNFMSASFFNKS